MTFQRNAICPTRSSEPIDPPFEITRAATRHSRVAAHTVRFASVATNAAARRTPSALHTTPISGDVVEKKDTVSGQAALVPLANAANRQGRLVADVIAGLPASDPPAHGTAILGVFDLTAAVTGWNEKRLRAAGRPFRVLHSHPLAHAGYYPGARALSVKLLVDAASAPHG